MRLIPLEMPLDIMLNHSLLSIQNHSLVQDIYLILIFLKLPLHLDNSFSKISQCLIAMLSYNIYLILAHCSKSGHRFTVSLRNFRLLDYLGLNRFLKTFNLVFKLTLHDIYRARQLFIKTLQSKFHCLIHIINVSLKLGFSSRVLLLILHHLK
jgi:hypothetical protein